jgi:hypothetical protein
MIHDFMDTMMAKPRFRSLVLRTDRLADVMRPAAHKALYRTQALLRDMIFRESNVVYNLVAVAE